jgi:hypothetical protein
MNIRRYCKCMFNEVKYKSHKLIITKLTIKKYYEK